jgi:hypothetical protein
MLNDGYLLDFSFCQNSLIDDRTVETVAPTESHTAGTAAADSGQLKINFK